MMSLGMRVMQLGFAATLLLPQTLPQDRLAQYKTQFEHEKDPVRKAKLIAKLGAPEFEAIRRQVQAGNLDEALDQLGTYRDECVSTYQSLKATGANPEQKPAGFKQFQISLRESLNRLTEILAGLPGDEQRPFAEIQNQLEGLDGQLIRDLFPRQPRSNAKDNSKP